MVSTETLMGQYRERYNLACNLRIDGRRLIDDKRLGRITTVHSEAMTYVWGWQDAMGERDTSVSLMFADAYATVVALYVAEKIGSHTNIGEAWKSFRETGHIRDRVRGVEIDVDMIKHDGVHG